MDSDVPGIRGLAPELRPMMVLDASQTFWDLFAAINRRLKLGGFDAAAQEFRELVMAEADADVGILIMLAFYYIKVEGVEDGNDRGSEG